MRRFLICLTLSLFVGLTGAQVASTSPTAQVMPPEPGTPAWRHCLVINTTDHAIADCVRLADAQAKKEEQTARVAAEAAGTIPAPRPDWTIAIRNSSTPTADYSLYDMGTKGGSYSLLHEKGESNHNATVGVLVYRRPFDWDPESRFQLFGGASVVRSGAGASKKDIRDVTLGVTGRAWTNQADSGAAATDREVSVLQTTQYIRREDKYGASEGHVARLHVDVIWAPLASGKWLWAGFVPQAGLLFERRTGGGPGDGRWDAGYVGLMANKRDGRIQASVTGRWLRDFRVPGTNAKRRDHVFSASLDFFFYDTVATSTAFQPSMFITRQVGNDFLTGVANANKTELGLRIKYH